jgi:hypothetical protein
VVTVREDAQEQVGAGHRIVRPLDDQAWPPARIEDLPDRGLALLEFEPFAVPLQDREAADMRTRTISVARARLRVLEYGDGGPGVVAPRGEGPRLPALS